MTCVFAGIVPAVPVRIAPGTSGVPGATVTVRTSPLIEPVRVVEIAWIDDAEDVAELTGAPVAAKLTLPVCRLA